MSLQNSALAFLPICWCLVRLWRCWAPDKLDSLSLPLHQLNPKGHVGACVWHGAACYGIHCLQQSVRSQGWGGHEFLFLVAKTRLLLILGFHFYGSIIGKYLSHQLRETETKVDWLIFQFWQACCKASVRHTTDNQVHEMVCKVSFLNSQATKQHPHTETTASHLLVTSITQIFAGSRC